MFFITIFILFLFLIVGKKIFLRIFNPLSVYSIIWIWMLSLYELKLMPYQDLSFITWYLIIFSFLAYALGIITVYFARSSFEKNNNVMGKQTIRLLLFSDDGNTLKWAIILFGIIGLINALHTWSVLIKMFGGVGAVFLAASDIYSLRVHSKIEGIVPYFQVFSLIGIFLAGLYSAYKRKLSIIAILPLLGYMLKSLAMFARIGMLLGLVSFLTSYLLAKYYLLKDPDAKKESKSRNFIIISFVLIIVIAGAVAVRSFRGTYEKYKGTSRSLSSLRTNVFFSPSIYIYLSSHVGVLDKYLQSEKENNRFGETTFAAFYNFFSKFELTEKVPFDKKGYYIPMWTNTGTFLRDLHADYGDWGVFLILYFLGLTTSFFWFAFFSTGKLKYFVLLVYFFIIIEISFFSLIVTGADFILSLIFLLFCIPAIEKRALKVNKQVALNG